MPKDVPIFSLNRENGDCCVSEFFGLSRIVIAEMDDAHMLEFMKQKSKAIALFMNYILDRIQAGPYPETSGSTDAG